MSGLFEAVDAIRQAANDQIAPGFKRAKLWPRIARQFGRQQGYCDMSLVNKLEFLIETYVERLDDKSVVSIWKERRRGWLDEENAERHFVDCLRQDITMELLRELTELAASEAEEKKRPKK